jgi:signal transduction histidine kinase
MLYETNLIEPLDDEVRVNKPVQLSTSEVSSSLTTQEDMANRDFKRALAITRLSQTLDNLLGKTDVSQELIKQTCQFFNTSAGFIAELYSERGSLVVTASSGLKTPAVKTYPFGRNQDLCWKALTDGKLLFESNLQDDKRLEALTALPENPVNSFLAVPLIWRSNRVGVIAVFPGDDWGAGGKLTTNEEELVYAAAGLIGQILFNAHLLRESERARNDFTDMLVYGLKGPMASIMGALDLLYDSQGPDAQGARLLTIARRNGARMLTMIETMLDLNKLEHGDLQLELEKVRLQQLGEIIWQTIEDQLHAKGLTGRLSLPQENINLAIDLSRVLKMLHQLLENALYFTERGSIEIRAEKVWDETGKEQVLIVISDTGCGIAPNRLEELFDRFSRARQYRQLDLASGGGIGLNYAKLVINAHGGRIWAESPGSLGSGSSFYFTLPIAE